MPEYKISDTLVSFPFEPYPLQRDYMAKVIECLNNSTHGVLESPTGTGKTLSLLCSTLGWITMQKAQIIHDNQPKLTEGAEAKDRTSSSGVPKVIYASRTHSQLAQAMQELKRTSYHGMKAVILGSREQLCIHPDVMKETTNDAKIHLCNQMVEKEQCSFYRKVASTKDGQERQAATVLDIEDLISAGRENKCCPYYLSKEMIQGADIIFMPYNYLIDPIARKASLVSLSNSIVIFDEAHNIEKMLEDSSSMKISSIDIAGCIDDITHVMRNEPISLDTFLKLMKSKAEGHETDNVFTTSKLAMLKEDLLKFEKSVNAIKVINVQEGITFPGSYIFELMNTANLTSDNFHSKMALLESLILSIVSNRNSSSRRGAGLQKVLHMLNIVFAGSTQEYKRNVATCFKVHVDIEQQKQTWSQSASSLKNKSAKVVNFWCLSPNFGMQQLLGKNIRSIILTSGSLAPLDPLISELGLPVTVRLENPHIVTSSQVCVRVISHGPDNETLLSNFDNRDNPKYLSSLGRTILALCPVIPNGLLVFFPSYFMLNKCRDSWQASDIWKEIHRLKAIFVEPQGKKEFDQIMKEYYGKINDPTLKGAIFLAVCRGKVSEGLDFIDINGRAVIVTGLPLPPVKDPQVILKRKYLEENRTKQNESLSGDEWYYLEASRAVNQSIGRVIRHKNDYGAILLCDTRFNQARQQLQLSSWVRGNLITQQHNSFGAIISQVVRFFRNAEQSLPRAQLEFQLPSDVKSRSSIFGAQFSSSYSNTVNNSKSKPCNEVIGQVRTENIAPNTNNSLSGVNNEVNPMDFHSGSNETTTGGQVTLHKRKQTPSKEDEGGQLHSPAKKGKFETILSEDLPPSSSSSIAIEPNVPENLREVMALLRSLLLPPTYKLLVDALTGYNRNKSFEKLTAVLGDIFKDKSLHYLLKGMKRFLLPVHKNRFDLYIQDYVS